MTDRSIGSLTDAGFDAMGTRVRVVCQSSVLPTALKLVRELFDQWERELSRFRPDSGLSRLNQGGGMPVVVSSLLFRVVQEALAASAATDGTFDPTLGQRLADLGYDRPFAELPRLQAPKALPLYGGGRWRDVRLDAEHLTVTLPPGVALDLGGIAKGLAVDAAVERLRDAGVSWALVDAGGDLRVLGTPPGEPGWSVRVEGVLHGGIVTLLDGALATSGIGKRTWLQGRERRHHLLDPATGQPARRGLVQVTVAAPRAVEADVAAKVALIRGLPAGVQFLSDHGWPALWIEDTGHIGTTPAWVWPTPSTP
jgi:thiamine biosynthesis lipoprotein